MQVAEKAYNQKRKEQSMRYETKAGKGKLKDEARGTQAGLKKHKEQTLEQSELNKRKKITGFDTRGGIK